MKSKHAFAILLALCGLILTSCMAGPDYTPDVTAHAASYGGAAPTFNAAGHMTGVNPGTTNRPSHVTMFHD